MEKSRTTLLTQLILRGMIFVLFFLSLFVALPSFVIYLLLLFIVVNIVFGFINKRVNILPNIALFALTLLLFVFLIEYVATILGIAISFLHLLFFILFYLKGGEEKEIKKLKKGKKLKTASVKE